MLCSEKGKEETVLCFFVSSPGTIKIEKTKQKTKKNNGGGELRSENRS